jgi:S-DNA-T family DNA segregation ATPase FtsK/SpoIIIE
LTAPEPYDAETIEVGPAVIGPPVDPPEVKTSWTEVVGQHAALKPIIPPALTGRDNRRVLVHSLGGLLAYKAAWYGVRSPLIAARLLWYAARGAWLAIYRPLTWTFDGESWGLRQAAANRDDPEEWRRLIAVRDRHASRRVWVTFPLLTLALLAIVLVCLLADPLVQATVAVATVLVLAQLGRPEGKVLLDRVEYGQRFTRLTAEMVRTALVSVGIGAMRDPRAIRFPEEIHRDGPGYLARIDLPGGIEAVDVIERRGKLASGLRLPVDQVWPSTEGATHAGQLLLWVGYRPASQMAPPPWTLASPTARTDFFAYEMFGADPRQRPVKAVLFENSFLIGGQPGSGKTYGARTLAIAAALDPRTELLIAEFKGTADFGDLAPFASVYACGVDDEALGIGEQIVDWALDECERRGKRIKAARERGDAPLGKVTPELASKPGSGLHPVVIVLDEVHELFAGNKECSAKAIRAIKRGRALGISWILATQIPDKDSLPPALTRCISIRWCMSVNGQVENDMILGTGAYKRGATGTAYRPRVDAGWGLMTGLPAGDTSVRAAFPTPEELGVIVDRIGELRGARVVGGDQDHDAERHDVLADVLTVFWAGRAFASWEALASRLSEQMPGAYEGITAEAISARLRAFGVPTETGRDPGAEKTARGCKRPEVEAAMTRRELGEGPGRQGLASRRDT